MAAARKHRISPRTVRLIRSAGADGVGVYSVQEKARIVFYTFREIPCEIGGRGFAVHRLGLGQLYHVRVGPAQERSCECMGFLRHGHCRHVQALLALEEHGLLVPTAKAGE
jgi:hypothetical protein